MRTYRLVHRTAYAYDEPVTSSYGRAVLLPRDLPEQHVHRRTLEVEPTPADNAEHVDYFGNTSSYFAVTTPHRELVVTARSLVTVDRPSGRSAADLPRATWEDVARAVRPGGTGETADGVGGANGDLVALREALLPSHHAAFTGPVREWSASSFAPGRPLAEVLADLTGRVHTEMRYLPGSTTVASTHDEVLAQQAGVCQDFAHLTIAALRLHGVPARYVSGYLETEPPPGEAKLLGADASHAWVAAWLPGAGWVEVDPTNDTVVDSRYVVLGWGRDYADVPPLRGVIFTDSAESRLTVSVDLTAVDTTEAQLTDADGRTSPDVPR